MMQMIYCTVALSASTGFFFFYSFWTVSVLSELCLEICSSPSSSSTQGLEVQLGPQNKTVFPSSLPGELQGNNV